MEDSLGPDPAKPITKILNEIREDSPGAVDDLIPLVYDQLKVLARSQRSNQHTLQPTELVHEAWMKLSPRLDRYQDRKHFFAAAALSIRHILADYARSRKRLKRGGGVNTIALDENLAPSLRGAIDLVVLDECLEELERLNSRHAAVLQLHVFGGLKLAEVAGMLGISRRTAEANWFMARAWMCSRLSEQ